MIRQNADSVQAVYQSLLHLGWIDKLLDHIATIFVDLYKDQLKSSRSRVVEYPFDKYFDQQVRELEDTAGGAVEETPGILEEERKNPFVSSDNGGPPPPPVPSLPKGNLHLCTASRLRLTTEKRSMRLRSRWRSRTRVRPHRLLIPLDLLLLFQIIFFPQRAVPVAAFPAAHEKLPTRTRTRMFPPEMRA